MQKETSSSPWMQISRMIFVISHKCLKKWKNYFMVLCASGDIIVKLQFKKIFSKLANGFRSILTGETIHDSVCTLRIYKREVIKEIELCGELRRVCPCHSSLERI
jgi:hypothetical protein